MAEESKSWFPNIGILSDSALLGVDASEIRLDGARDEVKHKVDSVIADWF